MTTHWRGPILGADNAGGGLWRNVNLASVDEVRGPIKLLTENFTQVLASGDLATLGATVTTVGAVAANSDTAGTAASVLTLNPGTAANTGYNIQFNAAITATVLKPLNILQTFDPSGASNLDGREFVWFARFGLGSNATTWDGGALLGMFVTDAALLDPATMVPTVASTGGAGFHVGATGNISFIASNGAITAPGTTLATLGTMSTATSAFKWYDAGFRYKQIQINGAGRLTAYFGPSGYNMLKVYDATTILDGNLSNSLVILNGAANQSDLGVDCMAMGTTRRAYFTL